MSWELLVSAVSSSLVRRRSLLAGLAATPLIAACGPGSATPAADSTPAGGGFSYTDGRGQKIELETAPTVVVAQSSAAAALWDAGFKVKGAYGELQTTDGKLNFQAGNLDLSQVSVVGATYGEFSVEKLAALAPQLVVDMSFDNKTLWYLDAKLEPKVTALCPTLGIDMPKRDLEQIIGSFTDLAVKLGADPSVSAGAKARFDTAATGVKTAVQANSGQKVAVLSFDADKAYVANPAQNPDLLYVQKLGGTFVKPNTEDYFETISYEKLPDYDADVIMVDARGTDLSYQKQPTYQQLSAVKAGRVFPWYAAAPYSYASSVSILDGFAKAFSAAAT